MYSAATQQLRQQLSALNIVSERRKRMSRTNVSPQMGESDIASEQRCCLLSVLNNLSHWHPFTCHLAQRQACMSFNRSALIHLPNQWLLPIPQGHRSVTITRHCQQKMTPESRKAKWCQFNQRAEKRQTMLPVRKVQQGDSEVGTSQSWQVPEKPA